VISIPSRDQQSKVGDEMGALVEKSKANWANNKGTSRQQGELAERAERQMKQLLDESIAKGTAHARNNKIYLTRIYLT